MKNIIILIFTICFGGILFSQNIVEGEYFFDNKQDFGEGTSINILNVGSDVSVDLDISVTNLSEGFHRLFVRFKDNNGHWGQTNNYPIYIKRNEVQHIIAGEYFFDEVGNYGTGTSLDLSSQAPINEVLQGLPVANLPEGIHRLFIRFLDNNGLWSQTLNFNVFIKHKNLVLIEAGEFFIDEVGEFGEGFPIDIDNISNNVDIQDIITVSPDLIAGQHILFYRFKASNGLWSQTFSEIICTNVVDGKYFTDQISNCSGDSIQFNYTGNLPTNAIYNWDLDNDGIFSDLQTNGSTFHYLPDVNSNNTVFKYRITSNLCPNWQKEDSIEAVVSSPINIDESISAVTCFESCDGAIDITVDGGIMPYSFQWSNNSSQEDQTELCSGIYQITVTDSVGCIISKDNLMVEEADPIMVTTDAIGNEMSGQNDGFINITVEGGATPYTYEWSFNDMIIANDEDIDNLSSGEYTLILIDLNGCMDTTIYQVDNIVATSNIDFQKYIKVFPNPTTEDLNLQFSFREGKTIQIELLDDLGKQLIVQTKDNISNQHLIFDVQAFPEGVYILKISTEALIYTEKILLTR